jgi:hypothetical protein
MKLTKEMLTAKCSHGPLQTQDRRTEIVMGDRVQPQPIGNERGPDAGQMNAPINTMVSNPNITRYMKK